MTPYLQQIRQFTAHPVFRKSGYAWVWVVSVILHLILLLALGHLVVYSGVKINGLHGFQPADIDMEKIQHRFGKVEIGHEKLYQVPTTPADPANVAPPAAADPPVPEQHSTGSDNPTEIERILSLAAGKKLSFFGLQPSGQVFVFVIDVSGSMYEKTGPVTRLKRVFDEIRQSVAALAPGQRFNIILFATKVACMSDKPLPATQENKVRAIRFLNSDVDVGGSTDLASGLSTALGMSPDVILLLTDGEANTGSMAILAESRFLRKKCCPEVEIDAVGFCLEPGSVPEKLLLSLTGDTHGRYTRWRP